MQKEEFEKLLANPGSFSQKNVEELKTVTEEYPFFQAGWVLYLKSLKDTGSPEYKNMLKKVAVCVNDRKLLYRFLNSGLKKKMPEFKLKKQNFGTYQLESAGNPQSGNSLIDKFLKTDPGSIKPVSVDGQRDGMPINNSVLEKSVAETDEIVTETLASILYQQKNYEKAIDAYRKLSLKFPEKSVYFASRIKEIEEIKNT